ncbi:large ribosomal subunit protein bL32m isoform X2 [Oryzias latipes]
MNLSVLIQSLRCSLLRIESRLLQASGLETNLAPALAVDGPSLPPQLHPENQLEEQQESQEQPTGLLDSILWMAAPKKRRTIEVNRTRRRSESKLIKVKGESSGLDLHPSILHYGCSFISIILTKQHRAVSGVRPPEAEAHPVWVLLR